MATRTNNLQDGPGSDYVAVSLSDTVALANGPCRALYVGVSGDVKVTSPSGNAVTFKGAPVGVLPIAATLVWSTGTTATDIVALY